MDASPRRILRQDAGADDLIENLGDEIATLAAHIHAATHRLLVLIARFDRLRGWEPSGEPSCAHWLHARTGIDLGAAREKVRAARALESLPLTSEAMSRGELSFSKVRALTRIARADNESDLLDLAKGATTAQLERLVRAWRRGSREDEAERAQRQYESRTLSVFPDQDGMYRVLGLLTPEAGALVMRAMEAGSDALFREHRVKASMNREDSEREAAQRRADALTLIAERALAAGFGRAACRCEARDDAGPDARDDAGPDSRCRCDARDCDTRGDADPDAGCECPRDAREAPISGTRAERYQVVLHVDEATLGEEGEPGRSELEDGTRVSPETSRRLSCDAGVVEATHGRDGSVLDVGRKRRTIPPALRRALEIRDRGCRFPGCGRRFTDGHHVRHWADGGETSLRNCLLLCAYHHRLVHEGGWRIVWWGEGRPLFYNKKGEERFDGSWTMPPLEGDPVAALTLDNREHGADPDSWTASARWKRERDIPHEVLDRASEAL